MREPIKRQYTMNIRATEFTREDGLQAITVNGNWILRRTDGICQFYQPVFGAWVVAHSLDKYHVNPDKDIRTCYCTFEQVMMLLGSLPGIK